MRIARTISIAIVLSLVNIYGVIASKELVTAIAGEDELSRVTANLPFTIKPIELPQIRARVGFTSRRALFHLSSHAQLPKSSPSMYHRG
jgi:hypothetical protein